MDRATLYEGPAVIERGGVYLMPAGNVSVVLEANPKTIKSAIHGVVDQRVTDGSARISFTPDGRVSSGLLSQMFPHTSPTLGSSLLGSSDTPATLWPLNGKGKFVFTSTGISKMPDIDLSSEDAPFGPMEIFAGLGNGMARGDAGSLYTFTGTAAFPSISYDATEIKTPFYTFTSGFSSPWDSFRTEAAPKLKFSYKWTTRPHTGLGVIDLRLTDAALSLEIQPAGMTEAEALQILTLTASSFIGKSLASIAQNVTLTGSGTGSPVVVVNKVAPGNRTMNYEAGKSRFAPLVFNSIRSTGGTLFSITLAS